MILVGVFFAMFLILGDFLAPFWIPLESHLALWGRPLAHFWLQQGHIGLQKGALGTSLGPFGGSEGPLGVNLGVLGRLLPPKWSKNDAKMMPK